MIRLALLGLGRWGKNHLRVLRSLPVELYAVDSNPAALEHARAQGLDDGHLSTHLGPLLPKIDAGVVVTPAPSHFALASALLEAGKDAFVEKPFTLDPAEAFQLAERADRNGRILQVGHIFRFDPATRWLRREIAAGRFGSLRLLRGIFSGFKRPRSDTGVTYADAVHFVDLFRYLLGSPPASVNATLRDFLGRGLDDASMLTLVYETPAGPVVGTIETGYFLPGKTREVTVVGDRLTAVCDFNGAREKIRVHENRHIRDNGEWGAIEGKPLPVECRPEEPLAAEMRHFVESVASRQPPLANGWDGYESIRVLQAAVDSSRRQAAVFLNGAPHPRQEPPVPLSRIFLDDEVRAAVHRALDSGRYILAKECAAFEEELAAHTGVPHAILASSWTMGVFMLWEAIGLRPGDEVIVPAHTAFPTIEPLLQRGVVPVFADVDETYCLDPAAAEAAVTPRTVGLIPVHLYGHPADLSRLQALARRHGLWVLEDCAQAQGARCSGRPVGSLAPYGAFSFFPSKNLTVYGDGGCITTDDETVAAKLRMLRNHGRASKYLHQVAGYNSRFNEIQAAAGRAGLRHLDRLNAHRRALAAIYDERLGGVVRTPVTRPWAEPVYHLYVIRAPNRDALAGHLRRKGIATSIHYPIPNHQQPAVRERFHRLPQLPHTESLVGEILSLPMSGALREDEVHRVCDAVLEFYGRPPS